MNTTRAFLIAGALALGGAGCLADNTVSLIIVQNQVLDPLGGCAVPSTATMTSESRGVLDIDVVEGGYDGYFTYPLVLNNLINRGNPANGVVSRDSVTITGAEVQLEGVLANSLGSSQTNFSLSTFGGSIAPSATAGMSVNVIPRQVALQMGAFISGQEPSPPTVVAHFRVTGIRAGGTLDSGYIDYPITVCRGCLTAGPPQPCPAMPVAKSLVSLGGCNSAQDQTVTCCTQGQTLLCGSKVPVATTTM